MIRFIRHLALALGAMLGAGAATAQTSGGSLVPAPIRRWMLAVIGAIADNPGMLDASGRVSALPARFVDRALDGYIVYDRG